MVIINKVFSIPLRAEKTLPDSPPVRPPKPTPLFCKITLTINAIEVIIKAMSKNCCNCTFILRMNKTKQNYTF